MSKILERAALTSENEFNPSKETENSKPQSKLDLPLSKSNSDSVKDIPRNMKDTSKRMSISLTGQAADVLDQLAKEQSITQNEALRKAIGTESYIREELSKNSKFIIKRSNGEQAEIIFR